MKDFFTMSSVAVVVLVVSALSQVVFAQSEEASEEAAAETALENTLTIDPIELFATSQLIVEYERVLADYWSWFGSVGERGGFDPEVLRAGTGVRFFFAGEAPEGWFFSPNVDFAYVNVDDGPEEDQVTGYLFQAGGLFGYTALLWDNVVLSGGLGINYGYADADEYAGETESEAGDLMIWDGILPAARINIGGAF